MQKYHLLLLLKERILCF